MTTQPATLHKSTATAKETNLLALLASYENAIVAYSGGVDSTYLAFAAHRALGDRALIVTARSGSMAEDELAFAQKVAQERGWNFRVIDTHETADPRWQRNDFDRCYFCKTELFTVLGRLAATEKIGRILYGAIPDDAGDVRPGQRAADEFAVAAPLVEAGLTKDEIRELSRAHDLPSWDKPQTACLASRFPTGTAISDPALRQVDRAEKALRDMGFVGHRVRHHGDLARIELQPNDWPKVDDASERAAIVAALKECGYRFVTIDLGGYRPAGLNT